jgi:hypothetical protein
MFLMEYADGVKPYVLEWYYEVFLEAFNQKDKADSKTVVNSKGGEVEVTERIIALTTEDLVKKTRQVYNHVYTKHQIRDTYIYPLINQGYIDETDSEIDKRQRIYYPLVVLEKSSKNERLHDKNNSLNLFQQSKVLVENYELYPSKQYIKSEIEALLKCVVQTPCCKEIKLLDNECNQVIVLDHYDNKEINIAALEEFGDRYYHSPQEYFHFNGSMDNDKMAVATAVTNNILYGHQVLQNQLSKNNNNFDKNAFEISHFQNAKITSESQQSQYNNIKNTIEGSEEVRNLNDTQNIAQSLIFPCYYCDYGTNDEDDYERHVIMKHPSKVAYPNKLEVEKLGLKAQGKSWEI